MLVIPAALLAASRGASVEPLVQVTIADRDLGAPRLRFERWYEGVEPDGPGGAACPGDGSLLRVRIDPTSGTLYRQRVAAPSAAADFDAWTAVATVDVDAGAGCHAAGTRVAIAYYDGAAVVVRLSDDSGATLGAPATIATAAGVTAVACAARADGSAAVTWAAGGAVWASQRSGLGAWSAPAAWSLSLVSVNALAMTDAGDWIVHVSGEDGDGNAGAWVTRYGSGLGAPVGHWLALAPVIEASPGTDVTYRATSAAHAGAPRLVLVESYAGTGAFDRAMLSTAVHGATFDGGAWRDPTPLECESPYGAALAAHGDDYYLCTPGGVWHAAPAVPRDVSATLLDARYESTRSGERLRLVLDASTNAPGLDALAAGCEIAFSPGAMTATGPQYAAGRVLWATTVRRTQGDGRSVVEVDAEGARERLARWRAPRQLTWAAGDATTFAIARHVAALAGVPLTADAPSTASTTLTPAFTVRAGESGRLALERLFGRTADALLARGPQLAVAEHQPDDGVSAAYGAATDAHALHAIALIDEALAAGWVRVLGEGVAAQGVADPAPGASEGVAIVVDEAVTDADVAAERAAAMLRRAALDREHGWIEASPHPGQERGDVVEVTAPGLGLDAARYRVTSVRFEYARRPRAGASMRLGLGAL